MERFQSALKSYLNRQIEKLKLDVKELVRTCVSSPPPPRPLPSP